MQLVAYGAQDIYLTGNPQITFFKVVYRRHTNFSMEAIEQTLQGTTAAGNSQTSTISRNGDLIHRMYFEVTFDGGTLAKYDNVGAFMIDTVAVLTFPMILGDLSEDGSGYTCHGLIFVTWVPIKFSSRLRWSGMVTFVWLLLQDFSSQFSSASCIANAIPTKAHSSSSSSTIASSWMHPTNIPVVVSFSSCCI